MKTARDLARRLSPKPNRTAAVPTQTMPGGLGTVTALNTDGTATVTYNGGSVPCNIAGVTPSVGESVLVLVLGTQLWAVGPVNTPSEGGAWTPYTPMWFTSGSAASINNGAINGAFQKIGHQVAVRIGLTPGSTTDYGSGSYAFGLPIPGTTEAAQFIGCYFGDLTNNWTGIGYISDGGTEVTPYTTDGGTDGSLAVITASQVTTAGQLLLLQGVYESDA